eukprot:5284614-Prymnesium_polylepis.1
MGGGGDDDGGEEDDEDDDDENEAPLSPAAREAFNARKYARLRAMAKPKPIRVEKHKGPTKSYITAAARKARKMQRPPEPEYDCAGPLHGWGHAAGEPGWEG